jgi:hypothetical protein
MASVNHDSRSVGTSYAPTLKTIVEIMGHKSHKMAMRYQHPTPDHKLNAVKALDGLTFIKVRKLSKMVSKKYNM